METSDIDNNTFSVFYVVQSYMFLKYKRILVLNRNEFRLCELNDRKNKEKDIIVKYSEIQKI